MDKYMLKYYRELEICTAESHRISEKMQISREIFPSYCFRVNIGSIGNDEYKASISVPMDANFGYGDQLVWEATTAEIMLFKNDECYYCEKWGYPDICRFYGKIRASDDENIDDLNNELERLRNCIKKYNDSVILIQRYWRKYLNIDSIILIQRRWRKCRYDPKYKMCEKVQMRNLENIEN